MNLVDPLKLNTETLYGLLLERFAQNDVALVFMTNAENNQKSVVFLDDKISDLTLTNKEGKGSIICKAKYPQVQKIEIKPGLLEVVKNEVVHTIDSIDLIDIDQNITFTYSSVNGALCEYQAYLSHFRY